MNGILCVNKPEGITSFGVVSKVRGMLGIKKVGHAGTLDPMATGVLPLLLGSATRFLDYLPDSEKGYRACFILGKTTDTLDITGRVVSEAEVNAGADDIKRLLPEFTGRIMQLPPMYSAKSVGGVRLYELARQGVEIERTPFETEISRLDFVGENDGEYTIDVLCSKGTYIRSLIDDIGRRLGCGAVMTSLVRTRAAGFTTDDCVPLSELQRRKDEGEGFDGLIIPVDRIFSALPSVCVSEAQAKRFANGGALDINRIKKPPESGSNCSVYSPDGRFLGLGRNNGEEIKAVKLLPQN